MPVPPSETCDAMDMVAAMAAGDLSSVAATEDALARIERWNPTVGAFVLVDGARALEAARASDARRAAGRALSAIDGLPVTMKDLADVAGWPTRKGSATTDGAPAEVDAPFTAHLRAAGAVILGKTATPEFGWKGVTDSPLTGICRNPWDVSLTPGGSSGGAAAAAALGLGWLHQGSDAGGSIRIPAAFCGVAGLKPTFGRVPQWPPSAMGPLSHLGPIARSIRDCALMMETIARPDPRDPAMGPADTGGWVEALGGGVAGRRVALWRAAGSWPVHPEVEAALEAGAAALAAAGAEIEEAAPDLDGAAAVFDTLWRAGAARLLAHIPARERQRLDPGLLAEAEAGAALDAVAQLDAEQARLAFAHRMAAFQAERDFILSPAVPIPAFAAGGDVPEEGGYARWPDWTPFTYPLNLTQQPVASVPWGRTRDGRPVGLQIAGRRHEDRAVLAAASALEERAPRFSYPA